MTAAPEYRPGLEDVPAAKSAVSFLDGKRARLEYRGIPVDVRARESNYEEGAWLVLKGELPTQRELADFDHAANFYYMLFGQEPTQAVRKVLDAALVTHAEHTMNASTFTARVTGSSLANPYAVVASAIGTLSGPLHGGANEEALEQFEQIG